MLQVYRGNFYYFTDSVEHRRRIYLEDKRGCDKNLGLWLPHVCPRNVQNLNSGLSASSLPVSACFGTKEYISSEKGQHPPSSSLKFPFSLESRKENDTRALVCSIEKYYIVLVCTKEYILVRERTAPPLCLPNI